MTVTGMEAVGVIADKRRGTYNYNRRVWIIAFTSSHTCRVGAWVHVRYGSKA
jgi:hypothetical protein